MRGGYRVGASSVIVYYDSRRNIKSCTGIFFRALGSVFHPFGCHRMCVIKVLHLSQFFFNVFRLVLEPAQVALCGM